MLKIINARPTGGRAGKGHNKTTSIQVIDTETRCIKAQFRYTLGFKMSRITAYMKAQDFVAEATKPRL